MAGAWKTGGTGQGPRAGVQIRDGYNKLLGDMKGLGGCLGLGPHLFTRAFLEAACLRDVPPRNHSFLLRGSAIRLGLLAREAEAEAVKGEPGPGPGTGPPRETLCPGHLTYHVACRPLSSPAALLAHLLEGTRRQVVGPVDSLQWW